MFKENNYADKAGCFKCKGDIKMHRSAKFQTLPNAVYFFDRLKACDGSIFCVF